MPPMNNINTALSDEHLFDVNCNIWKTLQEQVGQHPLIVNKEITNLGFKRNAVCDMDARLNPVAYLIIFQKIKLRSASCNPNTFIQKHTTMAPGSRPDRWHCRTILELTEILNIFASHEITGKRVVGHNSQGELLQKSQISSF